MNKMKKAYQDPSKLEVIPLQAIHDEIDIVVAPVNNQWEATIVSIDNRSSGTKFTGSSLSGVLRNVLMGLPKNLKVKKSWSSRVRSRFLKKTDPRGIHVWCGAVDLEGVGDTFMAAVAYKGASEGAWFGKTLSSALDKLVDEMNPEDFGKRWVHDWESGSKLVDESNWEDPF